jgi:hypothetical protein
MEDYIDKKDAIISDLMACKKAFDQVQIPWVVMGGIVLGYARYKDIMPWDTDLDIGIFADISYTQWESVKKALSEQGYKKWNTPKSTAKRNEVNDFSCAFRKTHIDLLIFHKSKGFYICAPKTKFNLRYIEKAEWFDEIQFVDFLGDKYPMPNYIEDFVTAQYGPNWKTNVVKDHSKYHKEKRGDPGKPEDWYLNRFRKEDGKLWWPVLLKSNENIEDFDELRNSVD